MPVEGADGHKDVQSAGRPQGPELQTLLSAVEALLDDNKQRTS